MRSIGNSIKRIDGLLSKQAELVGKVEQLEAGIERFLIFWCKGRLF